MKSTPPRTILITGATDGIGLALARYYQRQGQRLILVGRRPLANTPLAGFGPEQYCQVDLSGPDCADQLAGWLAQQQVGPVDLLIHNAATGYYGSTAAQSGASVREIIAVNLHAPIAISQRLLPWLTKPGGKIVFISSVVAALACPEYAVYGASKAALDGFARNLRLEWQDWLDVQVIYPGATKTGMHAKSGAPKEKINWDKFPPAEHVAEEIAQAIERPAAAVTIGRGNRLLRLGGRYLAGLFDAAMRRRYR